MESGGARGPAPSRATTYAGTGVTPAIKEHTAKLAVALQAAGVPMATIVQALRNTDYAPEERTLFRHMAAIKAGQTPLSAEKASGRPATLTDEEWEIVFGWVLQQNKIANLEDVQRWIKANLHLDVSIATISRHKDTMGMSFKLVSRRGMPFGTTRDEYVLGYFDLCSSSTQRRSLITTPRASSVSIL